MLRPAFAESLNEADLQDKRAGARHLAGQFLVAIVDSAFDTGEREQAMEIMAYDPYIPSETLRKLGAKPSTLEELLSSSDLVSIHVPLTKETRHLIGKKQLAMMKSTLHLKPREY